MLQLIMRTAALLIVAGLLALSAPALAAADTPPTPPCPQVQGWNPDGTVGPIDNGNGVQFECVYALPNEPEQLTLDLHWYKPTARDVDVDFTQCGRASSGGSNYATVYSGKSLAYEEYIVSSGPAPDNVSVFQADQQVIQTAAYTLLAATDTLAKSCTPSSQSAPVPTTTPPPATPPTTPAPTPTSPPNTTRPTVAVQPAKGRAGRAIPFRFTVSDPTGSATILLTIYHGSNTTPLLRQNYGSATAKPTGSTYAPLIRARHRGSYLWCITATNPSGDHATACSSLVVR